MYVIQEGKVEIVKENNGKEVQVAVVGEGEFVGEMEIFEGGTCVATVRALGTVQAITVDKKLLLRLIIEDPSLAFHLVEVMSSRVRKQGEEILELKSRFSIEPSMPSLLRAR
jgi:CRP-like cAMP-binding protein